MLSTMGEQLALSHPLIHPHLLIHFLVSQLQGQSTLHHCLTHCGHCGTYSCQAFTVIVK